MPRVRRTSRKKSKPPWSTRPSKFSWIMRCSMSPLMSRKFNKIFLNQWLLLILASGENRSSHQKECLISSHRVQHQLLCSRTMLLRSDPRSAHSTRASSSRSLATPWPRTSPLTSWSRKIRSWSG